MIRYIVYFLSACAVVYAGGVSVRPDAEWRPATKEQARALLSDPAYHVIDFSFYQNGGAGSVLETASNGEISKQFVEQSVAGFLSEAQKGGISLLSKSPGAIGRLNGVCITGRGQAAGTPFGMVAYLVYSTTNMYAVAVYGPEGLTPRDALVSKYTSRVALDQSVMPGDIEKDSAFEAGRKFGYMIGRFFLPAAILILICVCCVIVARRRREMKPPPLDV